MLFNFHYKVCNKCQLEYILNVENCPFCKNRLKKIYKIKFYTLNNYKQITNKA